MKKFRLSSFGIGAATLLMLSACNESMFEGDGTGTIAPVVSYDATVVGLSGASSRAEVDELTVHDLTLTLSKADGSMERSFAYDDFDPGEGFTVGKYTMTASYGDPEEEGFNKTAVFASAELTVTEGQSTAVELIAKPNKAMVILEFDESLTNYLSDIEAKVRTAYNSTEFPLDETRHVYVRPGHVAVDLSFTKPNGMKGTSEVYAFDAQARHRYKVTLRLAESTGGVEGITVSYDDGLTEEEVDVDISDKVLAIVAPEITLEGVTEGEVVSVVEGSPLPVKPTMKVTAKGAIKSALLVTSGTITEKGWPDQIDLATASINQLSSLEAMGLRGASTFRNGSKFAALDFSEVANNIDPTVETASPNMFSLTVTDATGKIAEATGFGIKVNKLDLTLRAIEGVKYDLNSMVDVLMTYNGSAPLKNVVKFEYLTTMGMFSPTTVAEVTAGSRSTDVYTVTINIPDDAQTPIVLKATGGSVTTDEIIIPAYERPVLTINPDDVFATSLWASVSVGDDLKGRTLELQYSTNGSNYNKATVSEDRGDYHISAGLTPGTTYKIRAKAGTVLSNIVEITTEADTQLPNGDMESWTTSHVACGAYGMDNYIPAEPWATLNNLTTSAANQLDGRSIHVATVETDDAHSGKAAAIRTVGWGASGATPYNKQPENHTAGELYLGSYSDLAHYGMDFASRPSALKFWYKFSEFNSGDKAMVEIEVLDADGNIIAQGNGTYGNTNTYTEETIQLSYSRGSAKAASLRVKFRSSDKATVSGSDVAHLSTGLFTDHNQHATGATFYVDDITLLY